MPGVIGEGPQTPYEVFCHRCRVTFPVGARHCIHCGGRLSRNRQAAPEPTRPTIEDSFEDIEETRRGFSPTVLIWAVLLISGALVRACAPGQG